MEPGVIIFLSIFGVVVFIVALSVYSCRKKEKLKSQAKAVTKRVELAPVDRINAEALQKWYKDGLREIVRARLEKESDRASGEPVLLSYYISRGEFRHWVLHTHGHKYELRRVGVGYGPVIKPSNYSEKARRAAILRNSSPEVGQYYYSVIGWTTKSKEEVDEACRRVGDTFGIYNWATNNCQNFLNALGAKIVTHKAPDWQWFQARRAMPAHSYAGRPVLKEEVLFASVLMEKIKAMQPTLEGDDKDNAVRTLALLKEYIRKNGYHPDQGYSSGDTGDGGGGSGGGVSDGGGGGGAATCDGGGG